MKIEAEETKSYTIILTFSNEQQLRQFAYEIDDAIVEGYMGGDGATLYNKCQELLGDG